MLTPRRPLTAFALLGALVVATTANVAYAQQPTAAPVIGAASGPAKGEAVVAKPKPWRLARALDMPDWFYFEIQHRSRVEYLVNQFRAERGGDGGLLSFRTGLFAELSPDVFRLGVEVMDSRAYFSNDSVGLNTTHMNPIELLQGYVGLALPDIATPKDSLTIRAGRITMDIGSRRLMARNRFRNTINTFTGVDALYKAPDGLRLRAFAVLPIQRRPGAREDLVDNKIEFDRESFDVIHGGVAFTSAPQTDLGVIFSGYAFGTYERDGDERRTKNRRLFTPGFRILRKPKAGEFDFQFESAVQVGVSRSSSSATNEADLDHLAMFQHASVGYSPAVWGKPRIVLEYDYATGDDDRRDGTNGRFETLFGARRFDYGPTGIYGPIARANVQTPGIRVQAKPHKMVKGFVGYRVFWLDEAADGWTTSGGVNAGPGSDARFLGHQIEARVRIDIFPDNLRIEPGVAHFFPGTFLDESDTANDPTDTTMLYLQVAGKI